MVTRSSWPRRPRFAISAKKIKAIVAANGVGVATIRKIRCLDADPVTPEPTEVTVNVQADPEFAKLRQAFADRLANLNKGGGEA